MDIDTLLADLSLFDNWQDRYQYLIDMGRGLAAMDPALKTEENKVRGCQSQVWLVVEVDAQDRLRLLADSDSAIVKGLVGIILALYDGRARAELAEVDVDGVFEQLGLQQHLSINRRNGFYAMVERIKALAR